MTTLRTPLCDALGIEITSGQAGSLARRLPAKDLVRTLVEEACDTIERLRRSLTRS